MPVSQSPIPVPITVSVGRMTAPPVAITWRFVLDGVEYGATLIHTPTVTPDATTTAARDLVADVMRVWADARLALAIVLRARPPEPA